MDRKPEHLTEDPILRAEFIGQESFDEYIKRTVPWFADSRTPAMFAIQGVEYEDALSVVAAEWQSTLHPGTNVMESLYLQGYTDRTQRLAAVDQMHAELKEAAIAAGWLTREQLENGPS